MAKIASFFLGANAWQRLQTNTFLSLPIGFPDLKKPHHIHIDEWNLSHFFRVCNTFIYFLFFYFCEESEEG